MNFRNSSWLNSYSCVLSTLCPLFLRFSKTMQYEKTHTQKKRLFIDMKLTLSLPMSFWEVKWQGVTSFRRIWLLKVLIFLNTLRLHIPFPKSHVCIAGEVCPFNFFFSLKLRVRVRYRSEMKAFSLKS